MHTTILKLIISICAFAIFAQAQATSYRTQRGKAGSPQTFTHSNAHELEINSGEKDYLLPGEGFANKAARANATVRQSSNAVIANSFPAESIVEYTSFTFGTKFSLHAFDGKYVRYLMADTMIGANGLSRDEIRELVDLTDLLYVHMAEIVGGEPSGDGLLTIALLNPGRDFGGKGEIGSKGVEMFPAYLVNDKQQLSAGCLPNIVIHEMAHNFDVYNSYISHDGDNVHAWTAFLIPYVQYYSRTGVSWNGLVIGPDELLDHTTSGYNDPWDAAAVGFDWDTCIKNGNGCWDQGIYANETWAGVVLRFARLHGTLALRRVFSFVKEYKMGHPVPPTSAGSKNDLLVLAFAKAINANIQCELTSWRWPLSLEMIQEMKQQFPGQNSFCNDLDGDGYTPVQNDRDDFNRLVNPASREILNGIDDDCDGIVDDVAVHEDLDFSDSINNATPLTLPSHIIGRTSTAADRDTFQLEINAPQSINIWLTGMGQGFSGWLEIRYASDPDSSTPMNVWSDYLAGSIVTFDRAGTWSLTVVAWSDVRPAYQIFLGERPSRVVPNVRVLPISKSNFFMASITTNQNEPGAFLPTDVRIWAEGVGFIAQQRFEPTTLFKVDRYSVNEKARLRAQFMIDGSPSSNPSVAVASGTLGNLHLYKRVDRLTVGLVQKVNAAPSSERRGNRKPELLNK
jgi:hypothetical protein